MLEFVQTQASYVALDSAYLRGVGVILAFAKTFVQRGQFSALRTGPIELILLAEPVVLIAAAGWLHAAGVGVSDPGAAEAGVAAAGAAFSLFGWVLLAWSFLSWRALFAGHGVLKDHRLVSSGAYGFVRHPVYLAALLIWLGLGVAFRSFAVLLITVAFVIPAYLLYIRSEETMMVEAFGEAYGRYREVVPMLLPRRRRTA
jgi:protein-S-isoprenylcysteine O-methyltransferase Ste14